MATGDKKFKQMPEVDAFYRHYKGGKYKVLTLAEHSEKDEFKRIFEELALNPLSKDVQTLVEQLKKIALADLVVYRSVHYGSTHARPLEMWHDQVDSIDPNNIGSKRPRFIIEHS